MKSVTGQVDEEVYERLRKITDESDESLSSVVREAVNEFIWGRETPEEPEEPEEVEGSEEPSESQSASPETSFEELLDSMGLKTEVVGPLGVQIPRARLVLREKVEGEK